MIHNYQLDETILALIQQPKLFAELEVPLIWPRTLRSYTSIIVFVAALECNLIDVLFFM